MVPVQVIARGPGPRGTTAAEGSFTYAGSSNRDVTGGERATPDDRAVDDRTVNDRTVDDRSLPGARTSAEGSFRGGRTSAEGSSPGGRSSAESSFPGVRAFDEGSFTGDLAHATTSRPTPARFATCYSDLAAGGATAIVSIHVSGELSGTIESAMAAARDAPVPVEVIDSRSIAMGLGYPVLAAARAAASGASPDEVAAVARHSMRGTRTFFYVDTLDYLRRSGRIGAAASLFGSALMIRPLLHIADGRISLLEKVRTSSRAIARLEDLAVEVAGERPVEVAVQHLAARERAEALAERLRKRVPGLRDLRVVEVGAVIGVHVGPGMLGLTVTSPDL
ncbi:DegV family protein [Nonomuraea sp. GTA35]|uniref:DegV family protein n=1 Tax=Nonomuraea sp. GTA35 TaxID=1676746 RepID=UPI0035C11992